MTTDLAEPGRIQLLPRDKHRRPVPWFVAWVDGAPDFRLIKPGGVVEAVASRLCWICGCQFLRQEPRASVIGPMCAVNRISAEPPSHESCATYAARACPFLATPNMIRRDRQLPPGVAEPPGTMIRRNPGVACVWVTKYNAGRIEPGPLFSLGAPLYAEWWARGRPATRAEVVASITSGMPELQRLADEQGAGAQRALAAMHRDAQRWIPRQ